jgi:hypothetical protein
MKSGFVSPPFTCLPVVPGADRSSFAEASFFAKASQDRMEDRDVDPYNEKKARRMFLSPFSDGADIPVCETLAGKNACPTKK